MGFIENYRKARDEEPGWEFEVIGKTVVCPHCGSTFFEDRSAQLNTRGMTFLGLDWANATAVVLECVVCGRLEWFMPDPNKKR